MDAQPRTADRPRVVVVGAGVSGLLAARRLAQAGVDVVVVDAQRRLGGQIETRDVAGVPVDVGAEALHLSTPATAALVDELDLRASMVASRAGSSWLWTPTGLKPLPAGVGPAGPTRLRPVLSSRVMSAPGLLRAGLEPLAARVAGPADLSPGHDEAVGAFVARRFGGQVVDRFVDPLLGSLHAGDVHTLSLRACAPSLAPAAREGRSLLAAARRRQGHAGARPVAAMSFVTWRPGLSALVDRLAATPGVTIRRGRAVTALVDAAGAHGRPRYRLDLAAPPGSAGSAGDAVEADAVVLAVPNPAAAALLRPHVPAAATRLDATVRASVATLVLGYPRHVVAALPAFRGTGLLVPSGTGSLLKAATFLSRKWPHLSDGDTYYVRLSAGRAGSDTLAGLDDDDLLDVLRRDLRAFIGLDVAPRHVAIRRWPHAMPQLTVGHPDRVAATRADLAVALPGVALAGASYDGIGLASCLASAERAAATVLDALAAVDRPRGPRP